MDQYNVGYFGGGQADTPGSFVHFLFLFSCGRSTT